MNSTATRAMVIGGFLLVLLTEATVFVIDRRWALPVTAVAVAVFAVLLRDTFVGVRRDDAGDPARDDALESLHRWKARTESLIRWADATRADWDRHLRPRLAREFMLATRIREPAALAATGRMVFGEQLWEWVDPENAAWSARDQPGPGRDALDEILRRLEQT